MKPITYKDLLDHCEKQIKHYENSPSELALTEHLVLKRLLSGEPLESLFHNFEEYDPIERSCETCKWDAINGYFCTRSGITIVDCWESKS